jgi:hypothetical protein
MNASASKKRILVLAAVSVASTRRATWSGFANAAQMSKSSW